MLEQAWKLLDAHVADIRDRIKSGVREDLTLGVCKNCGGQLRVLRGKTGKRFAACVGKEGEEPRQPAAEGERPRRGCGQTFPLPQRGTIVPTGNVCAACGWPEIKVVGGGGRGRPWVLCVDIDCPSKEKYKARKKAG
jgi:DNA topoisomerase-1